MSSKGWALVRRAVGRGWRKRCPHCGRGRLFAGREHLESCPSCGLVYERNQGDTWAFTILGDRLPIGAIIAIIYFGLGRRHPTLGIGAFIVLLGLIVITARNRWGVGIALHYLSRIWWPDPQDPVPESPC
jgi:uncharacterized protein (DUF983 family)